jgi:hypothetical protein
MPWGAFVEFHVQLNGFRPDLDVIGDVIRGVDAAALLDIDPGGAVLRIAAAVEAQELIALLGQAGHPVNRAQVRQLPSICCGGCSG